MRNFLEIGRTGNIGRQHRGVIIRQAEIGHKTQFFGVWQLGQTGCNIINPVLFNRQWQQIGAREVSVIMGFFFGSHRAGLVFIGIIKPGFLMDFAAIFQNRNLALGLIINRGLHEAHRVHIFNFATRAQMIKIARFTIALVGAGTTNRNIHIRPQISVLHVAVTGAQIAQNLADFGNISRRFFRPANVGARDDFHQGNAGAVQIDK